MSSANDNSAKSAFALLKPFLDDMKAHEASPEWQDILRSMEAINLIAKNPEQKP